MEELQKTLLNERKKLQIIEAEARKRLAQAPEGSLRLASSHGYTQYYHCTKTTGHMGEYIPVKQRELAGQLAQKAYDEKIAAYVSSCSAAIQTVLDLCGHESLEEIYCREHPKRQELIQPVELPWDMFAREWIGKPYEGKPFKEDAPEFYTEKGERVRSKSEIIIADHLYHQGVFYKYECPLQLRSDLVIYPDFTILSPRTRREIYWEHFGMMDNPEYVKNALKKILAFETMGIWPGNGLLLTFEAEGVVLNAKLIDEMIRNFIL